MQLCGWLVRLSVGLFLCVYGFYLISEPEFGYIQNYSLGNAIAPLGGGLVGYTISKWNGGKSFEIVEKLLRKI